MIQKQSKIKRMIGNTPLIKLERLAESNCAEIYVKYEGGNPTGSMKDRMALSMIEGAERRGEEAIVFRVGFNSSQTIISFQAAEGGLIESRADLQTTKYLQ